MKQKAAYDNYTNLDLADTYRALKRQYAEAEDEKAVLGASTVPDYEWEFMGKVMVGKDYTNARDFTEEETSRWNELERKMYEVVEQLSPVRQEIIERFLQEYV